LESLQLDTDTREGVYKRRQRKRTSKIKQKCGIRMAEVPLLCGSNRDTRRGQNIFLSLSYIAIGYFWGSERRG